MGSPNKAQPLYSIGNSEHSLHILPGLALPCFMHPTNICISIGPRIARVSKIKLELSFPGFCPNPGPGCFPLDSGCGDVEFAGVFASVAPAALSFVSNCIF